VNARSERWPAYTGVLAVLLWVVGVIVQESAGPPGEGASDAEYLAYIDENANTILTGGWIFMLGCVAFLWFAVVLRQRLAAAEGGTLMYANVAFVGAVLVGAFTMLSPGPDIAAAISSDDISESTAAALGALGDAFFVAAELSAMLLMIGASVLALRTRVFPKPWAWFGLFLAVILVIGPIGWAALLFGVPVWVLGTTWFLTREPAAAEAAPAA
jgi:hypothetical protein